MAGAVAPLDPSMRAVGPAHTLEASDVPGAVDDPYAGEVAAVDAIPAGAVVVVSTFSGAAIWGELLATAATARGAAGVVSDGPVRDSQQLREMGFATFCRGVSPLDAQGRVSIVRHGREVACAGVRVGSGDHIVADADGVVAVPRAHLADVARLVAEGAGGERGACGLGRRCLAAQRVRRASHPLETRAKCTKGPGSFFVLRGSSAGGPTRRPRQISVS